MPADNRWNRRSQIADIVRHAMSALPLAWPEAETLPDAETCRVRHLLRWSLGEN